MNPLEKHAIRESNEDYHRHDALSASGLKKFRKSPLHYKHSLLSKPSQSPAMKLGSLAHTLVLEPHLYNDLYAVTPEGMDRRTKAGREQYNDWFQSITGKSIITEAEYETAQACADAVRGIIPVGLTEPVYRASTRYGWLQCRCDRIRPVGHTGQGWELKTVSDIARFERQAFDLGYHWQEAMYTYVIKYATGAMMPPWIFVAVETKPPYDVIVRRFDESLYPILKPRLEKVLDRYAECRKTDQWPGVDGGVREAVVMQAPPWIERELCDDGVSQSLEEVMGLEETTGEDL